MVLVLIGIGNKDRDALATLYERYGRRVFALSVRILTDAVSAEEVTQDVFMSVWRRGATYTSKKGKFTTWLFSIAHNRTIDELRKRRRDRSKSNDDIMNIPFTNKCKSISECLSLKRIAKALNFYSMAINDDKLDEITCSILCDYFTNYSSLLDDYFHLFEKTSFEMDCPIK